MCREIAQVKPAAYENAGRYLRKIREGCRETGWLDGWWIYLVGLRLENKRRPRLLEVLDSLESRRGDP